LAYKITFDETYRMKGRLVVKWVTLADMLHVFNFWPFFKRVCGRAATDSDDGEKNTAPQNLSTRLESSHAEKKSA
jgi:hypothetical protein